MLGEVKKFSDPNFLQFPGARTLDCYTYGPAVMARARSLGGALQRVIGDLQSGDVLESAEAE